ncbi:hypothetical protein PMES_01438 [Profundibacterium mesophilum KAUST100406-0324]|uniref:Uncharacterized protein n=1 Tax=Profundibacterium mesophilum KAUST100406-0324 TaxID=1037889 RepID=A0A921NVA9_9RHOB|nr:hypothetical protein PMES_01438 [Profundibacterium mesophilum KAUST100406-0324]
MSTGRPASGLTLNCVGLSVVSGEAGGGLGEGKPGLGEVSDVQIYLKNNYL